MRADIHGGPEQKLQSEAGYIDARPQTDSSTKTSCNARPDHTFGSFSTELGCPRHVRFGPDSGRRADMPARQLRARSVHRVRRLDPQLPLPPSSHRPGLPSVVRCFLSRVLLGSSIASTDWMYSAIYSGGRPCSLPPARTKSLYQP